MKEYGNELKRIERLLKEKPKGKTVLEISHDLSINRNSVAKYLDVLLSSGKIEMRKVGPAKMYYPANRVPLSALLNYSSDGILVIDKDLKIVNANSTFLAFHPTHNDVLGENVKSILNPFPDKENILNLTRDAVEGKEGKLEFTLIKGKTTSYFKAKFIPTTFEDGSVGTTIVVEDISQIRRSYKELEESRERYFGIYNNALVGIYRADIITQKIIDCNPRFCSMMGYNKSEGCVGKGKSLDIYYDKEDQKRMMKTLKNYGMIQNFETKAKRNDGSIFWALISATYNKSGHIDGVIVDIDKQKRAQIALSQAEQEYRKLLDSLKVAIHVSDENQKIVFMNRKFKLWSGQLGLDKDPVGKSIFEVFPFLPKNVKEEYRRVLKTGDEIYTKDEIKVKGKEYKVETQKFLYKENGTKKVITIVRETG